MHGKSIMLGLLAVLATAAPVFAWGGGGGQAEANGMNPRMGKISGTFRGGSYQGTYSNGQFSGTYTLSASEPLGALAVGLGLLGTRYLRRRR
jgi:hypothetical protein